MIHDTAIGGPSGRFPLTRLSLVRGAASAEPETRRQAFDSLIAAYWKPVYKTIRIRWRADNEDAKDLTQGFFAQCLEKDFFARYDPAKASFRTYLRTCLEGFLINEHKASRRLKRGGGQKIVSLDFESAEGELRHQEIPDDLDPETFFYQEWTRSLFGLAVDALRRQCLARGKSVAFALFEIYDLDAAGPRLKPSYQDLAREFDLPVTQVTNFLAAMRRDFRRIVLEILRDLAGSEAEFRAEARALLGVEAP